MSDAPLIPESSAANIRERFEVFRREDSALQRLRKLLADGNTSAALAVANALGEPLPMHQVVSLAERRARP